MEQTLCLSTRNRKHESGAEKLRKKQRLETFAQSQKGALDRFVVSVRETLESNVGDCQSHRDDILKFSEEASLLS
jgi:hypothetical protein